MRLFVISNQQIRFYLPIGKLKLQIQTQTYVYAHPHILLQYLSSVIKMRGLQENQRPWSVLAFCMLVLDANRAHAVWVIISPMVCLQDFVMHMKSHEWNYFTMSLFMSFNGTVPWHLYLFLSQQLMQRVRSKHSPFWDSLKLFVLSPEYAKIYGFLNKQNRTSPLKNGYTSPKPALDLFKLIISKISRKDLAKYQLYANHFIKYWCIAKIMC